jgi:hypothetical protein
LYTVEKELTAAIQNIEEQEKGRKYLLAKVATQREKVGTANKMIDTLNILGKYLLDKVSRMDKRKEGIEASEMQVRELGSRIRVTDWNELEEQSSELLVIDTLIEKYSKSKVTGSEEVITEAQTLRKCIIQYQKDPQFKISVSSEFATAMEECENRKRPQSTHASMGTKDGIFDLEDAVDQFHIDDYVIDVEDSSRTEKRSNLSDPKWSFDFISTGISRTPDLGSDLSTGDMEDDSLALGMRDDVRFRHCLMIIYKSFLEVESTMKLKIKDKPHNRDQTYVAVMTEVVALGITAILMISNVNKTYIAFADKSKGTILRNAYPNFIRRRLRIRMEALNKQGMANTPDKCALQTVRYALFWHNFYHGMIFTDMRVDERVFTKESLLKITAVTPAEGNAMMESLMDMRQLSRSSPKVITRNLNSMELWNRYIPILTYPSTVLTYELKPKDPNPVERQIEVPDTVQVPHINNDPSKGGSKGSNRKRKAT